MEINKIDFADSQLKKITIIYDELKAFIELDDKDKTNIQLICTELIGIDNLCIFDDTYIDNLKIMMADRKCDYFKEVTKAYPSSYLDKDLNKTTYDIRVTLVNGITCHIYCQKYIISKV